MGLNMNRKAERDLEQLNFENDRQQPGINIKCAFTIYMFSNTDILMLFQKYYQG